LVCSLTKTGTCNPPRARIRIVDTKERGRIVPIICQDCEEPVCMPSCPVDAISRNSETGAVEIDPEICTNCRLCLKVCPFGGPLFDPVAKEVVICDQCRGNPACVDVCPTMAIVYGGVKGKNSSLRLRGMMEIRKSLVNLGGGL
jgi:Fe-S-cluster-containing dehydrogenase component